MKKKNTFNQLKSQEREIRISLILDAAEKVFENKPFDKVSMQEIADEAGIAKSSIYTYFTNQETLFVEAVIRNVNDLVLEMKQTHLKNSEEPSGEDIINSFIDFFAEHDAFFRMMTMLMASGNISEESLNKLNETMRMVIDFLDETFFRDISYNRDHRLLSHAMLSFLNGLLVSYRKLPGRSEQEVLTHMKEIGYVVADIINYIKKHKKKETQ